MIELRWVVSPRTDAEAPRLQYRYLEVCTDASGSLCPGNGWSEWRDIPTVVGDLPEGTT